MNKFTEGTRVIVIGDDNEIRKGSIQRAYEMVGVAVVKFEDGEVEKVKFNRLGIEKTETVKESEIPEDKQRATEISEEIKYISKKDFTDALMYVTSPEGMPEEVKKEVNANSLLLGNMAVMCSGLSLIKKLYENNEILSITKEQLKQAIDEHCTPTSLSETVNGEMDPGQLLGISCLSLITLRRMIPILFGESEND